MTRSDDFHAQYTAALRAYLGARDEDSLAVGHELGRRALEEQISMLDIIEHHVELVLEIAQDVLERFSRRRRRRGQLLANVSGTRPR